MNLRIKSKKLKKKKKIDLCTFKEMTENKNQYNIIMSQSHKKYKKNQRKQKNKKEDKKLHLKELNRGKLIQENL